MKEVAELDLFVKGSDPQNNKKDARIKSSMINVIYYYYFFKSI